MPTDVVAVQFGATRRARLMIPAIWRVIPVSSTTAEIEALAVELGIEGTSNRQLFRQSIIGALDQAKLISAVFVAMLFGSEANPVAASIVACEFPDEAVSALSVELQWLAAGRTTERLSMAEGPMIVTAGLKPMQLGDATETIDMWEMQVAVPHLESSGLLFSLSTPMVPLAQPLRTMALAMISTMRWNEIERSSGGNDPS